MQCPPQLTKPLAFLACRAWPLVLLSTAIKILLSKALRSKTRGEESYWIQKMKFSYWSGLVVTAELGGNRENSGRQEWNLGEASKLITIHHPGHSPKECYCPPGWGTRPWILRKVQSKNNSSKNISLSLLVSTHVQIPQPTMTSPPQSIPLHLDIAP